MQLRHRLFLSGTGYATGRFRASPAMPGLCISRYRFYARFYATGSIFFFCFLLSVDLGPQGAIVHVSCQAVVRVYSLPAKLNTLSALLCVWCGPQWCAVKHAHATCVPRAHAHSSRCPPPGHVRVHRAHRDTNHQQRLPRGEPELWHTCSGSLVRRRKDEEDSGW